MTNIMQNIDIIGIAENALSISLRAVPFPHILERHRNDAAFNSTLR